MFCRGSDEQASWTSATLTGAALAPPMLSPRAADDPPQSIGQFLPGLSAGDRIACDAIAAMAPPEPVPVERGRSMPLSPPLGMQTKEDAGLQKDR